MLLAHRLVKGIANRILDKRVIRPRNFSNEMIRRYAPFFEGSAINISGWRDEDGEGNKYKSYFPNVKSYSVSNVSNQRKGLGSAGKEYKEIEIDLTKDLPHEFFQSFDLVLNHTTLEHIYDFKKAFKNICDLSRDVVIIIVPVMQQIHQTKDFGDYWRPTTMTVAKMFRENGLEPLVIKCNDQPFAPVYCFGIASRNPIKYEKMFKKDLDFQMGAHNYGSSLDKNGLLTVLDK
ncbi:MAG: hypothetical protein A3J09_00055 [Candidatus Zambryskibacteria bacterium RIFCSPLOWO2_02_FULL_51_21]|nr:MAG: hypothetical protein A3J09_00055 [Candidatus Zambryskibacteria bacterium RIFCSPLOWO2_02_FULL_51_21]